jgi:hypothetical protein
VEDRPARSPLVWPAAAAALVVAVGGAGRWGSNDVITVDGADTSDGKLVIAVGVVSLVLILAGAVLRRRWAFFMPVLGAGFAAVVCILDLSDFNDAGADIGWGLYAAIAGSIVLVILALVLLATPERPERPERAERPEPQ